MHDRLWRALAEEHGVHREDSRTWTGAHASGLQEVRLDPVFQPIGGDVLTHALDALLGPGAWQRPKQWGQFLVTFPTADAQWRVPTEIWHTDFGFLGEIGEPRGALVFSFLSEVPPGAGGTPVIAGSHRVVERFVARQPASVREKMRRVRTALMRSHPWFTALTTPGDDAERLARFRDAEEEVEGVPLQVRELTGSPGDVVVAHPWLLHASAVNVTRQPRVMCVQRIRMAVDALPDSAPTEKARAARRRDASR